jgi:hypothetical protein
MSKTSTVCGTLLVAAAISLSTTSARAFCGIIQESATASTAERAVYRADRKVNRQVRALKRQHREKLQLDERAKQCLGGGIAIDANGNQIVGKPSCTVTQPFCVNP